MREQRGGNGFSLLEVVFATFLILFMLLTIMSIFTLANRPAGNNRMVFRATALAEKELEQARRWAETSVAGKYNFELFGSGSDPWNGASGTDPLYPGMTWKVDGEWEKQTTDVNQLTASARKLRVQVEWEDGSATLATALVGMISEPVRPMADLQIAATGNHVTMSGTSVDLTATAHDASHGAIPDLTYRWTVLPATADGTLTSSGHVTDVGQKVTLSGRAIQNGLTSGTLTVQVTARSGGVDLKTASGVITVTP